jgi:hypothetical protein
MGRGGIERGRRGGSILPCTHGGGASWRQESKPEGAVVALFKETGEQTRVAPLQRGGDARRGCGCNSRGAGRAGLAASRHGTAAGTQGRLSACMKHVQEGALAAHLLLGDGAA